MCTCSWLPWPVVVLFFLLLLLVGVRVNTYLIKRQVDNLFRRLYSSFTIAAPVLLLAPRPHSLRDRVIETVPRRMLIYGKTLSRSPTRPLTPSLQYSKIDKQSCFIGSGVYGGHAERWTG